MSPILIAALGGIALAVLLHPSDPHRQLQVGKSYVATFLLPPSVSPSSDLLAHLQGILPAGSAMSFPEEGKLAVRFVAVSSDAMGDIPTPLGTFKITSLKEVG